MDTPILEKEVNTYTIKIYTDNDPQNPREEWDNFGKMACFHRNYKLGDKHSFSVESLQEFLNINKVVAFNLYLYDHSGITIATKPFSCIFDSGQVGVIYATYEEIRKEYKVQKVSPKILEQVKSRLLSEVEVYDRYLTGQVYGYVVEDSTGENIDSCWGYYESPESVVEYCEENIVKCYDYQSSLAV